MSTLLCEVEILFENQEKFVFELGAISVLLCEVVIHFENREKFVFEFGPTSVLFGEVVIHFENGKSSFFNFFNVQIRGPRRDPGVEHGTNLNVCVLKHK